MTSSLPLCLLLPLIVALQDGLSLPLSKLGPEENGCACARQLTHWVGQMEEQSQMCEQECGVALSDVLLEIMLSMDEKQV